MAEHQPSCPGCSSAVPAGTIALKFQLKCPVCRIPLRVPLVYQANFGLTSIVLGLVGAYLLGVDAHFLTVTFFLAFVIALFLGTTIVPLVPPRLEIR